MEKIIKKLIIIGCGKIGQAAGIALSELPLEVVGIRRSLSKENLPFKMFPLDIFSADFENQIKIINPNFAIYCISSDNQTEKSYQKNYVDGLKLTIKILNKIENFQHLFFTSSTRVYGQISDNFLSELESPKPADSGGKILFAAEKSLKNVNFNTTILRLSGIYGDKRRHMLELASDLSRWPTEDRWTNRIHEEDVVSFIYYLFFQIIENKKIENLYLLTDNHPVTLFEVLKWIRLQLKLPLNVLNKANQIKGKRLKSKILPTLNFSLKHPNYKSGYRQMISRMNKTN